MRKGAWEWRVSEEGKWGLLACISHLLVTRKGQYSHNLTLASEKYLQQFMGSVHINQMRLVTFLHQIIPTDDESWQKSPSEQGYWETVCFVSSVISGSS